MNTRKFIQNAIDFDPVAEAEKLGNGTSIGVAIAFSQDRSALLKRLMDQTGDVYARMTFNDYCSKVETWGFQVAYEEKFIAVKDSGPVEETFRVYWHPEGWLLKVESYTWGGGCPGPVVNTAQLYYNIQVSKEHKSEFCRATRSGCWIRDTYDTETPVWCGYHDAREALKHTIESIKASGGQPLSNWIEPPHLWFILYTETPHEDKRPWHERSAEWDTSQANRIAMFPEPLRSMLQKATR